MARPFPPELQGFLEALAKAGIEAEVVGGADGGPINSKEEFLELVRSLREGPQGTENVGTAEPAKDNDTNVTNSELALLETISHGLTKLHSHLCPRITKVRKYAADIDAASLKRDEELCAQIVGLTRRADTNRELLLQRDRQVDRITSDLNERIQDQAQRITELEKQVHDSNNALQALANGLSGLRTEFRTQAGLLHRRVTKRKQEISTKSNKRKSKRVSDHSAD